MNATFHHAPVRDDDGGIADYVFLGRFNLSTDGMLDLGGSGRCDRARLSLLVRLGLPFMTFGMLSGALWAEAAWGICWSWDPKETCWSISCPGWRARCTATHNRWRGGT